MPLTFGKLQAGNWPSSAPAVAVLEGVLGFLPNKTKEQICREIRQRLIDDSDSLNEETFDLSFTYRHDCSVVSQKQELPQRILQAGQKCQINIAIDAMTASSDAWFYNNQLGIPTVVYGPGTLTLAHSAEEQIKMADIGEAAKLLGIFAMDFSGVH